MFRLILTAFAALILTGCGIWGGSDEVKPAALVEFTPEKQVQVRWSADIGKGLGDKFHQFSPVVIDNTVYGLSADGVVAAFKAQSGQRLWQVDLDETLLAGVGAGGSKVVVVTESGVVICLDAKGQELWRRQMASEVVAQPQLNQDLVVLQTINGNIVALESATGAVRWSYDRAVPRLTLRGTGAPLVAMDVTLSGQDNGRFVALDNRDGAPLWEQNISIASGRSELERMTDIDGRPLLFENTIYVPAFQGQLVAINPFNAQTLWKKPVSSFHSLAAGFGNIYISTADDEVQALDAKSAASVWRQTGLGNRAITAPAVVGNAVAVGDQEGHIHFMSQIDGHFVARFDTGSRLTGDMVTMGDTLFVLTDAGKLLALTLN